MARLRFLALALLAVVSRPAAAGFDEGWAAYQREDFKTALEQWRPLAEAGDTVAQYNLGVLYDGGLGVPRDVDAAMALWTKAAEAGLPEAQHNLALLHLEQADAGREPGGYETARGWLEKAVEQGFVRSQYTLGKMYMDGVGMPADAARGFALIRAAGEAGLVQAQYNLGKMFRDGAGVEPDPEAAAAWWRRAAEQGYAKAQDHLATRYARGDGVPRDMVAALGWTILAAQQGHPDSVERHAALIKELDADQIAAAERMAKEAWERYLAARP